MSSSAAFGLLPPPASASQDFAMPKVNKRTKAEQYSVIAGPEGELKLGDNLGSILYVPSFLSPGEAAKLFRDTLNACSWERTPITLFGKTVLQPRDTAFFGTRYVVFSQGFNFRF